MTEIIRICLIITGLHFAFKPGNVLAPVRGAVASALDRAAGLKWSKYIQKPLWDCMPCMASVWGILLSWSFNIPLLCAVCGLNVIISQSFTFGEGQVIHGETEYFDDVPTISRQKTK